MVRKLVIQLTIMSVLLAVLLFWPAGTLDGPGAWILLGEYLIVGLALCLWLLRYDPALLRERLKVGFQKEQIFWDKVFIAALQVVFFGWLILMAFDAKRWALSHLPEELNVVGAILIPVGFFVIWLTFRENTFAAAVIKIQKERGQTVVTTGPYRWVRHPMYAGATLYIIGTPLLLGSWIGLAVLPLLIGAMMLRIPMEERALRRGLPGYDGYAARVRYRLVPFVW